MLLWLVVQFGSSIALCICKKKKKKALLRVSMHWLKSLLLLLANHYFAIAGKVSGVLLGILNIIAN